METYNPSKTLSDGGSLVNDNACSQRKAKTLNKPDSLECHHRTPLSDSIRGSNKQFVSLWETGCPSELSAPRHCFSFGSVFASRRTSSMLPRSTNAILHHQGKLCPLFYFGGMSSSSDLATSISLIHCNVSVGIFVFEQTSVRKFTIQL